MIVLILRCPECKEETAHEINLITKVNHKVIFTKTCRMCNFQEGRKVTSTEWELIQNRKIND